MTIKRGPIQIRMRSGFETVNDAELYGPFAIHKLDKKWQVTHIPSGLMISPTYPGSLVRRIDCKRMVTILAELTPKQDPDYWEDQRPSGQYLIGQMPTTPELQRRHGNAHGMVYAQDAMGIMRGLLFSDDATDPRYQRAQEKYLAVMGRYWSL